MKICGLQKTTLLDYPGHIAAAIFLNGCNFRCPFCHNSELLDNNAPQLYTEEEFFSFLKKRRGILEGVCITGGEPTLNPELEKLILSIRELGYLVKLDTNGYRPDVLIDLCKKNLIDYVAMDIKTCRERYHAVSGLPEVDISKLDKSIQFLINGSIPYEFRTTVVKELHSPGDFKQIALWLKGCSVYYLQNYKDSENVLSSGLSSYSRKQLLEFIHILQPYIKNVQLRGVDN